MINHIRTLLLNRAALPTGTTAQLEEYVDPGFRALALPVWLRAAHTAAMPVGMSRESANAHVFTYLQLMHRPDFRPYFELLDYRITYDIDAYTLFELRRRATNPAVPDYAVSLSRLLASPPIGAQAMSSGILTTAQRDSLMYTWFSGDNTMQRLTAGLYLLVCRMEDVRRPNG